MSVSGVRFGCFSCVAAVWVRFVHSVPDGSVSFSLSGFGVRFLCFPVSLQSGCDLHVRPLWFCINFSVWLRCAVPFFLCHCSLDAICAFDPDGLVSFSMSGFGVPFRCFSCAAAVWVRFVCSVLTVWYHFHCLALLCCSFVSLCRCSRVAICVSGPYGFVSFAMSGSGVHLFFVFYLFWR